MTNDRFDHDAPPGGTDAPTHPNLDRSDVDPNAYRVVRIPDHAVLSRIRYQYDPTFHEAINVAYKWLDRAESPEGVFDEYAGRRIKITRNLLDGEYYGGDVEPFVAVATDDATTDWLLDWADETPSGYAERKAPEWLQTLHSDDVDPPTSGTVLDAFADEPAPTVDTLRSIDEARELYEEGEVSYRAYVGFVADMVEADPVADPSSDAEAGGSTSETALQPADWSWYDVARMVAAGSAIVLLIAFALSFFV